MSRIILLNKKKFVKKKSACLKWAYRLSGYDYRFAMLLNCYKNHHAKFKIDRKILYGRTDPNYRKASPLSDFLNSIILLCLCVENDPTNFQNDRYSHLQ